MHTCIYVINNVTFLIKNMVQIQIFNQQDKEKKISCLQIFFYESLF